MSLSQNESKIVEEIRKGTKLGFSRISDLKIFEFDGLFGEDNNGLRMRMDWGLFGVNLGRFGGALPSWGNFRWQSKAEGERGGNKGEIRSLGVRFGAFRTVLRGRGNHFATIGLMKKKGVD